MVFRRLHQPAAFLSGDALTSAMVGIGMNFAAPPALDVNIEDTLLAASLEGMERDDFRTLAVLTTWLGVHVAHVNADRLIKLVVAHPAQRLRAYWAAVAHWHSKDHRLARLAKAYRGPRMDLLAVGTDFQVQRAGEDPRFLGSPLRVPANVLRDRVADVLTPSQLAQRHPAYRYRVQMGPSYRADMWAVLEHAPDTSASDLARAAYGSFATAWNAKLAWAVLHPGHSSIQTS
jgi:hypothetical protein